MSNKIAYLNVFEDFFVKEVENLFDNFIKTKKTNSVEESTLFQAILPVALDPAPDGSVYQIELAPVCPHCGSREMASWGEAKPLRLTSEDIKSVTHDGWDKLSSQEKKIKIENAITDYLVKHAE